MKHISTRTVLVIHSVEDHKLSCLNSDENRKNAARQVRSSSIDDIQKRHILHKTQELYIIVEDHKLLSTSSIRRKENMQYEEGK